MPRRHHEHIEVELPPELDVAAQIDAAQNDDLENLDTYRLDYLELHIDFVGTDPPPEPEDFLRA